MCAVCYNMLCVPCMFAWQSVLCDQEHTLYPCGRHGPVVSQLADVWYMVSIEWNIVLTLYLLTQHIVYQLCWWVVHVSDQSCFFIHHRVAVGATPTCSV